MSDISTDPSLQFRPAAPTVTSDLRLSPHQDAPIKSWRQVLPVHPAAKKLPLMSQEELRELADDIKRRGLLETPTLYRDPKLGICVLDGRNRLDACELIGRETVCPSGTPKVGSIREASRSFDPFAFVISKNIRRRHLKVEERQNLLIELIAQQPGRSDRQIAKTVGVDHKTIGAARAKGEDVGRIPHVALRTDSKGRKQAAKKAKTVKLAAATLESEMMNKPRSAVAPRDEALFGFSACVLDLKRRIGAHNPARFAKTTVAADDLGKLGKFLTDLAQAKEATP
jgi:ParB-like chromosome segregation protein Spo0J